MPRRCRSATSEFDAVLSCIGVMFAPHHQRAADELVRVCRPGGTIGVISWTPEGFIGQMFATMKPYVPAAAARVCSRRRCGATKITCARCSATGVTDLTRTARALSVDRFADGAAFRDYFKANYGPTISAYRGIAGEPERIAALDADTGRTGRPVPGRVVDDGVGVPAGHRAQALINGRQAQAGAKRGAPPGPGSGKASTRIPHVTESGSQSTILAATRSPLCSASSTRAIT